MLIRKNLSLNNDQNKNNKVCLKKIQNVYAIMQIKKKGHFVMRSIIWKGYSNAF